MIRVQEFYIPVQSSSIHFLKTRLCIGCTNGFEIVDLDTLDTQGLLDPADQSLEFVHKRENLKPLAIYRIENEFLLCYDGKPSAIAKRFVTQTKVYRRIRVLCGQGRMAVSQGVHGLLGGKPVRIW